MFNLGLTVWEYKEPKPNFVGYANFTDIGEAFCTRELLKKKGIDTRIIKEKQFFYVPPFYFPKYKLIFKKLSDIRKAEKIKDEELKKFIRECKLKREKEIRALKQVIG